MAKRAQPSNTTCANILLPIELAAIKLKGTIYQILYDKGMETLEELYRVDYVPKLVLRRIFSLWIEKTLPLVRRP